MFTFAAIRRRTRFIVGPLLGLALIGYFGYHLVEGDRGLVAWMQLSQQIRDANATLGELRGERQALERRVSLLRPEHLDRDLLDERARATLNYTAPNEIVILRGDRAR
jgi:cell division protein FtsB